MSYNERIIYKPLALKKVFRLAVRQAPKKYAFFYHKLKNSLDNQLILFEEGRTAFERFDNGKGLLQADTGWNELGDQISVYEEGNDKKGIPLPPLTTLVDASFNILNITPDQDDPIVIMLCMAALAGEVENNTPYHNNDHYRKVMMCTIKRIAEMEARAHRENVAPPFSEKEKLLLLTAACIHDLDHQGHANKNTDPKRNEIHSYNLFAPIFESVGVDNETKRQLKQILIASDVTLYENSVSPYSDLKSFINGGAILSYKFAHKEFEGISERTAELGLFFSECDLMPSLMFGVDRLVRESAYVFKEIFSRYPKGNYNSENNSFKTFIENFLSGIAGNIKADFNIPLKDRIAFLKNKISGLKEDELLGVLLPRQKEKYDPPSGRRLDY